jgi:hypothetical protein
MPNRSESFRFGKTTRCAVCDSQFGLVRHYSWQTAVCSKKCVVRLRARHESDLKWVGWLQAGIAFNSTNRARAI